MQFFLLAADIFFGWQFWQAFVDFVYVMVKNGSEQLAHLDDTGHKACFAKPPPIKNLQQAIIEQSQLRHKIKTAKINRDKVYRHEFYWALKRFICNFLLK